MVVGSVEIDLCFAGCFLHSCISFQGVGRFGCRFPERRRSFEVVTVLLVVAVVCLPVAAPSPPHSFNCRYK